MTHGCCGDIEPGVADSYKVGSQAEDATLSVAPREILRISSCENR